MDITGTNGADTLTGTTGDDTISGLGGFDRIDGKAGNDVIDGGADGDSIEGGAGSDTLDGGEGDDFLSDTGDGSDTLRGGAGRDFISISHFGMSAAAEAIRIDAGTGDDTVGYFVGTTASAIIDLGDGADRLTLGSAFNSTITATLGTGRDTIVVQPFVTFATAPVFTDFAVGAEGDTVDIADYLAGGLANWDGSNPFGASGHLRLVQAGTSTALQIDRDGASGTAAGFVSLLTFQSTDAARFTEANFGGYAPDGSALVGKTITGTAGFDTLTGSVAGDTINGLAGADTIDGKAGNDIIDGGADNDFIQGGIGNDHVDGGEGNDSISDAGGSDVLRGGAGNDVISVFHSTNGPNPATETIRVEGGTGDDRVNYYVFSLGSGTIDLGEGADRLALGNGPSAVRATLGAGRDTLELSGFANAGVVPVITDFVAGPAGDTVDLSQNFTFNFQNWDGSNPFGAAGYLRLVASGANTLFQIDRDGAAGRNTTFQTLALLENTAAALLTADNFSGYAPTVVSAADLATAFVTAPAAVTEGTDTSFKIGVTLKSVANVFTTVSMAFLPGQSTATAGSDVTVPTFSGTYSITQSPASDYSFDLGAIAVIDDLLVEGEETIAIRVTASGQVFDTGTDTTVVYVKLRSNDPLGTAAADTLNGSSGDDVLLGLGGNDVLYGNGGADRLDGGRGNDMLFGGTGADGFVFDLLARGEEDVVKDFGASDRLFSTVKLADSNNDGVSALAAIALWISAAAKSASSARRTAWSIICSIAARPRSRGPPITPMP
jgi:Ca2+-binding RTX toxin-like protein